MKRISIAVMALVAFVAVALVPAAVGKVKVKKFPATVTLAAQKTPADTYSPGSTRFSGVVASGGPALCRSGRPVTVSGPGGTFNTTTASTGNYAIPVGTAVASGNYVAFTPKMVKKKKVNGVVVKKKVCKPGTSAPVFVP